METQKTAEDRYVHLASKRQHALETARRCAELTLPGLMPPDGWDGSSKLPQPYQGLGARAVNNLSNQLLMTLLPPGVPFYKLEIPAKTLIDAGELEAPEEVNQKFSLSEKLIQAEIESKRWRQPTGMALKLLEVTGNATEFLGPDNMLRVYRLDQYVVRRNSAGEVIEHILKIATMGDTLPEEIREKGSFGPDDEVDVYTWTRMINGRYEWHQEIKGEKLPGSEGSSEKLPFNVLRWEAVPGDDYGHGKVEAHLADFEYLEGLSKCLAEGSAMAAFNLIMVNPNAATGAAQLVRRIKNADNGDIIEGNLEDVGMAQFANIAGLQIAQAEIERLTRELSASFVMKAGMQRDAERVTAYELRMLAQELEGALSGVYSSLSVEMQLPRLRKLIAQMQLNGDLPPWSDDQVEPMVKTGLEALGREQDAINTIQAIQSATQAGIPPEEIIDRVDMQKALERIMTGFNSPGLIVSDEVVQQKRQQRAMQQAAAQSMMNPTPQQPA